MTICRTCQSSRSGQLRHRAATPGISSCPATIRKLATMVMEKRQAGKQSSIPNKWRDGESRERGTFSFTENTDSCRVCAPEEKGKWCIGLMCVYVITTRTSSSLNGLEECDVCVCLMVRPVLNVLSLWIIKDSYYWSFPWEPTIV